MYSYVEVAKEGIHFLLFFWGIPSENFHEVSALPIIDWMPALSCELLISIITLFTDNVGRENIFMRRIEWVSTGGNVPNVVSIYVFYIYKLEKNRNKHKAQISTNICTE